MAITAPADRSYDTDGVVNLAGTAAPNSAVGIFEGTTPRGTTTVGTGAVGARP